MLEAGNKRKTIGFIYFRVSGLNQDALGYLFKLFLGGSFLDHSPHLGECLNLSRPFIDVNKDGES